LARAARAAVATLALSAALVAALGVALGVPRALAAQEAPAKRLANVVGVAVDEYGKGVDAGGRIFAPLEYDEAVAFLTDARAIASRVADARSAALGALVDTMRSAVAARVSPADLQAIHARLVTLLGPDAALDYPTAPVDLAAGRAIYAARCASCHGAAGEGKGFASVGMNPPPPAFADAELMADVTPALMYRIVSVGIQGTAMTGYSDLSSAERWAVVTYVTTLRATADAESRGRALLAERCTGCAAGPRPVGHTFAWLAERHDRQLLGAIAAADAALGLDASVPLAEDDARSVVAALRAAPAVVDAPARTAATIAAEVLHTLDESLERARAGDGTAAGDLAFDAYVTFEPLEASVRTRDPGMVALIERHFADFKGAAQALDVAAAVTARERIAIGLPQLIALAEREPSGWGTFFESLLIIVREGFEAILILGAVIAFLVRTGNGARVREVRWGALAGLAASAALAVVLRTALVNAPASREVIEGATMLLAVAVLFSVSYWLLTKIETARWQLFIREKVGAALTSGRTTALAVVAFLAVFREGAETALFYQALLVRGPHVVAPVLSGLAVGAVALAGVWIAFHRFGLRIPLRGFFAATSALLYALAFTFLGKGLRELQEGNVLSITPVLDGPYLEPLGIFPSIETLAAQGVLVALALVALWRSFAGGAPRSVPASFPPARDAGDPAAPPVQAAGEAEAEARG
jgi:high-affinity iron transporter